MSAGEEYTRWFHEAGVWKRTTWHGIRTYKLPSDMWNYQEIIFERKIEHVIETGTAFGGSAVFFAEALAARGAAGPVVSIDIQASPQRIRACQGVRFQTPASWNQRVYSSPALTASPRPRACRAARAA